LLRRMMNKKNKKWTIVIAIVIMLVIAMMYVIAKENDEDLLDWYEVDEWEIRACADDAWSGYSSSSESVDVLADKNHTKFIAKYLNG